MDDHPRTRQIKKKHHPGSPPDMFGHLPSLESRRKNVDPKKGTVRLRGLMNHLPTKHPHFQGIFGYSLLFKGSLTGQGSPIAPTPTIRGSFPPGNFTVKSLPAMPRTMANCQGSGVSSCQGSWLAFVQVKPCIFFGVPFATNFTVNRMIFH